MELFGAFFLQEPAASKASVSLQDLSLEELEAELAARRKAAQGGKAPE